jgi:hypothetical protein
MFRHSRSFWFLLLAALLMSCGGSRTIDSPDGDGNSFPAGKISDHVFELRYGQTAVLASGNLSVTFKSVLADSRCPSGVVCFWEGEATIGLRVITPSAGAHNLVLTLRPGCAYRCNPDKAIQDTLGYRFQLLAVDPYPAIGVHTPIQEKRVTLAIFPDSPMDSLDGKVIISNEHPMAIQRFTFFLDTIMVNGDVMTLHIAYSGGCTEHEFELHMTPASFFETLPLQADLYLRHAGEPDPCDGFPYRNLSFDLRPILQLYEIEYGQIDCIALNVYDFIDPPRPVTKTTVIYHPDRATSTSWCTPPES